MGIPIRFQMFHGETLLGTKEYDQDIIKIGRLATAHLKLDDQKVSRIHAVVEVTSGRDVSIIDMGSAEGTYVNGEKVNKVRLKDGDTVLVGDTRLVISLSGAAAAASMPVPEGSGVFSRTIPAPVSSVPTPAPAAPSPAPAAEAAAAPAPAPAPTVAPPVAAAVAATAAAPTPTHEAHGGYEDELYEEEGPMETAPEPVPDASRAVLEVQLRWGHTVIEVQHHERTPVVTIGKGGDVHVDAEELPGAPKPLFTCQGTSYTLHTPTKEFSGFVRTHKGSRDLHSFKGESIALQPDSSGELKFHEMVVSFRFTEPRRKIAAAPFGALEFGWLNTLMGTVFMSAAFVATLILYPQDTKSLEEDLFQTNNRFTQFIINPEKKAKSDFLKRLEASKGDKGQAAAAAKSASGKAGKQDVPKDKPQGKMSAKEKRAKDEQVVQDKIAQLFGGGASGAVFSGADNNALENAMGGITGQQVGAAYGFGGLGERGHGPGGGGTSTSTFGVGRIGTRGRGGGNSGYGAGGGGLGGKTEHNIDISQGAPVILGSLDKEIIRRVIRENIAQIKYCYERELTRTPGLAGKVQVKFVIGAQGNVQSAVVAESSMNNKSAEACMTGKVRQWLFPKPKGGGIVIVTYPFIFKQGG